MKKETLKKGNELQARIDAIGEVSYATTCDPSKDIDSKTLPHSRIFEIPVSSEDAEKLQALIQKFMNNLKKQLQSEFDSLK